MIVAVKRFGNILTSRTEGREAALLLIANELRDSREEITLDFRGVAVLTPSWLGEFVNVMNERDQVTPIHFTNLENASVRASVETTQAMTDKEIRNKGRNDGRF